MAPTAIFHHIHMQQRELTTLYILSAHARSSGVHMRTALLSSMHMRTAFLLYCMLSTANGHWRPLAVIGDHFCLSKTHAMFQPMA